MSQLKTSREVTGVVVSDKMDKTVVVAVTKVKSHPIYKKRINSVKKYKAHNVDNVYKLGDKVVIKESRPLSKTKRWVVINKI